MKYKTKIEFGKETVFENDKDIFEIGEAIKTLNEMCNKETDQDKVRWYCNEIERVEDIQDKAYTWNADQIAEKVAKKEKEYQAKDFGEESEAYGILKWLAKCADEGKNTLLRTDDFGYGEHWKEEIPEWYLKDSNDDKGLIQRYYAAMQDLEGIFNHLAYFTEDVTYHFPEQRLFIKEGKYTYEFNYVVGQGSDFSVSVVEKANPDLYKERPIKFIFPSFKEAVTISKRSTYGQAVYYARDLLNSLANSLTGKANDPIEYYGSTMFLLGQATAKVGFLEYLNKDNFEEKMKSCDWSDHE